MKLVFGGADARGVATISKAARVRADRPEELLDRALQRLCDLSLIPSVLVASVVYLGWGVLLPLVFGVGTVGLISFATEGTVFAGLVVFARAIPFVERRLRRQQLQLTTSLRRLSSREFEILTYELFEREGWTVEHTGGHGEADGNIDLILRRGTERRLVQCKQWTARRVGVDEVRKLAGALLREGLTGADGVLVTSAEFYPAAITEAEQLGMELIDGDRLVDRLHALEADDLLLQPTRTDVWACPNCDRPMILDHSSYGWWLHCPAYANGCKGKHDLGKDNRQVVERLIAER